LLVVGPPVIANVVPEAPTLRLSGMQIDVLLLGVHHKLDRGLPGWACDDHNLPTGPAHLLRPVTIKSLHERGLLDANFGDSRVHRGELVGAQNLDGARHEHSPEVPKFQVWTRALVRQALKQKGLLVDDDQLLYH
jgi:hypothetical protein